MASENKRISADQIVSAGLVILKKGDPLIAQMNPNKVIIVDGEKYYSLVKSYSNEFPYAYEVIEEVDAEYKDPDVSQKDTVDLSDIEDVTFTKYFDPVSKIEKARVAIKIRNSSSRKKEVIAVDARIVL